MVVRFTYDCGAVIAITVGLAMLAVAAAPKQAHAMLRCWQQPDPKTLVEITHVQENAEQFKARQTAVNSQRRPAALLLSYGSQRTAYSAGLLVGWGETGNRPKFDLVTAVGPSAVIAPFAFIGAAGDQAIADTYNCKSDSWTELVRVALEHLDQSALEQIRQGHRNGRRLLISLKGSAVRPQTVWDIGQIAASRHPDALRQIQGIISASVDLTTSVPVPGTPIKAGRYSQRNHTFRVPGAGQPLLFQPNLSGSIANWYVVHNSVLFDDEVARYSGKRRTRSIEAFTSDDIFLRPVFDVLDHARQTGGSFRFAVVQPRRWFFPQTEFDQTFMRDVFLRAYRYARMGRLWQSPSRSR